MTTQLWWQLGLALGLGLLVGMEREQSGHGMGIRTFPLITLFGATTVLFAEPTGGWLVPAALLAVAAGMIGSRLLPDELDEAEPEDVYGSTTTMAAFLMFTVGGLLVRDYASVAVALAGTTALLLRWKEPLHKFVDRMRPEGSCSCGRHESSRRPNHVTRNASVQGGTPTLVPRPSTRTRANVESLVAGRWPFVVVRPTAAGDG